jgi:hypothetical protein
MNKRNEDLNLERTVSQQKLNLTTSLLNLKKNESKESHVCKCKTYCRINHQKHNYIRSKSDEIFYKLVRISTRHNISNHVANVHLGAIEKRYSCNLCEKTFNKQGHMKKHKKAEHMSRERKGGSIRL